MSGIRVNEWLHNSGTGGIWQTSAGNVGIASSVPTNKLEVTGDAKISGITTAKAFVPTAGQFGNRNLIINGACNVAQRGTSYTGDVQGLQTVDRFKLGWSGADAIIEQHQEQLSNSDTGPWEKGFRNAYKLVNGNQTGGAGAADYVEIEYKVESQDLASSGWDYNNTSSYIALSFWVKSSVAQTFYGQIRTDQSTSQTYSFSTGSLSANTWTKITRIIPGRTGITLANSNAHGISIKWAPFWGTDRTASGVTLDAWHTTDNAARIPDMTSTWWTTNDSTFHITGLQLEVGPVVTPFEHRIFADELQRCLRYYWKCGGDNGDSIGISGNAWAANYVVFQVQHPVHMRTTPTFVGYNDCRFQAQTDSASFDAATMSIQSSTVDGKTMLLAKSGTSGATAGEGGSLNSQEDGMYISFLAEL